MVGGYLQDELDDTFAIAEILVHDDGDLVRKAVGGWIREAGKRDPARLLRFLDRYASTMPRTMLRYALEHQSPETRRHYTKRSTSDANAPSRRVASWRAGHTGLRQRELATDGDRDSGG